MIGRYKKKMGEETKRQANSRVSVWDQSQTHFNGKKLETVHRAAGGDLQQTATPQRCP